MGYSMYRRNKYGNRKCSYRGITFDSEKEMRRYMELEWLEKKKVIRDLRRQVKYVLIPAQRDDHGKLLFRECAYVADFTYRDERGLHVEDAKGVETEAFKIKRKIMWERNHVMIEVIK